ncbi:hypothetical protein AMTRI_Chr08g210010 [Amborella trichopoda]
MVVSNCNIFISKVNGIVVHNTEKEMIVGVPMAQFIATLNASFPASKKFIIHMLDNTHLFVQAHAGEMIYRE